MVDIIHGTTDFAVDNSALYYKRAEKQADACEADLTYYDTLDKFLRRIRSINENAKDGFDRLYIQRRMKKTEPMFIELCNNAKPPSGLGLGTSNMNDTIKVANGWGQCPNCGNPKMICVNEDTRLVKFPAFCKRCKQESIVTYMNKPAKGGKECKKMITG